MFELGYRIAKPYCGYRLPGFFPEFAHQLLRILCDENFSGALCAVVSREQNSDSGAGYGGRAGEWNSFLFFCSP
jgi:hypothetical protein